MRWADPTAEEVREALTRHACVEPMRRMRGQWNPCVEPMQTHANPNPCKGIVSRRRRRDTTGARMCWTASEQA